MLRIALFLIVAATVVGAIMPSHRADPSAVTVGEDGVTYTPQTSGSSYRVVDGSSGRSASTSSDGTLRLDREDDGHFYLDAQVNGRTVHFLVDTGASGVALSRDDAQAVGLALDRGAMKVGEGASGDVMGQWVELDSVEVGHRTVSDVPAVVMEGGLQSLLGQNVLREFDIEVHGDEMLLR